MWGNAEDRKTFLDKAIAFTGDHEKYGFWMRKVINDWKYSCEHNLSNKASNRKAWLGHAACAYFMQCPEDIVRQAWSMLTEEQRIAANMEAEKAIALWEGKWLKGD